MAIAQLRFGVNFFIGGSVKKFPCKKIKACITIHGGSQRTLALAMGKSVHYIKAMFFYEHVPRPAIEWFLSHHPELFSREDFPNAQKE